jgi:hypothetical protein
MHRTKRFITSILFLTLCPTVFSLDKKEAQQIYEADTKKVRSGDLLFDCDLQDALKSADEIKNHNMAEPEGHLLAFVVYQKMGREQDASFEHKVVEAYLRSIMASGDGKSSETAYFVVNEGEEYFFINIVMGVGFPKSQSLVNRDGHSFDLLKIKDKEGNDQEIWFNVDTSMTHLKEALGEK